MRHFGPALALAFAAARAVARSASAQPSPDFLFGSPKGMIGFRSGWLFASANSDLFTFVQRPPHGRPQGFQRAGHRRRRRSRDGAAAERHRRVRLRAHEQGLRVPRFRRQPAAADHPDDEADRVNLSGSVKFAITPRGREISSRAFIPAAVTPYVGAGGGLLQYEFLQFGDFIDVDSANSDDLHRHVPLGGLDAERARVRRRRRAGLQTPVSQRRRALSLVERHSRPRLHRLRRRSTSPASRQPPAFITCFSVRRMNV